MNSYPLVVSQDLVFRAKRTTLLSSVSAINTAVSGLGLIISCLSLKRMKGRHTQIYMAAYG